VWSHSWQWLSGDRAIFIQCDVSYKRPHMHWLKVKVVPGFFIGVRRKGREQEWFFFMRGQQPHLHQIGGLGSAVSSPAGFRVERRPPKGFPLFSALRMASPDTIILLVVDYHGAVWAVTQCPPLHTSLLKVVQPSQSLCHLVTSPTYTNTSCSAHLSSVLQCCIEPEMYSLLT